MKPSPALGFIHRFDVGKSANAPTLLLLHGTGGDENDLIPLGRTLAPDAALLGVRGNVSENGMLRFFRRLAEGVFDLQDLEQRTEEMASFLASAAERYGFSLDSLIALGFSNGANIAASLLLSFPHTVGAAILIRPMIPFIPEKPPSLKGKPILLLSGEFDSIVPIAQPTELAAMFQSAGAEVRLHWERAGHVLTQGDVTTAAEWLTLLRAKRAAKLNYT